MRRSNAFLAAVPILMIAVPRIAATGWYLVNPSRVLLLALVLVGGGLAPLSSAAEETSAALSANPWYMTVVGGVLSGSKFLQIPEGLDPEDSYTFGVSVSKQFAEWTRFMRWEGELQVLKHFGAQNHWEFTGSVNLRWVDFPWNEYIETSIAIGEGLSWATEIPALEKKSDPPNGENSQLLNYILLEVTFAKPQSPWSLVTRIHHRSGAWGAFGDKGSNILEAGIRYRF